MAHNAAASFLSNTAAAATSATSSAMIDHLNSTTSNSTLSKLLSLPSSAQDVLLLPLRLVYKAEVFTFVTVPRHLVRVFGLEGAIATLITGVANFGSEAEAAAALGATAMEGNAGGAAVADLAGQGNAAGMGFGEMVQNMRRFSGFFSYMTSRWSLACLTVALILNRVTIYASTRRHPRFTWEKRLALRIIPIILFAMEILTLLRAIRCQTSPEYSDLRYGKPGKRLSIDYAGNGGFLFKLSSSLLSWESHEASCSAVSMGRPIRGTGIPYGSFSLLWSVFLKLCLNHFIETLLCALQGRPVLTEAGMSIFEHSLAFAEAETMISQSIGLGLFGLPKSASGTGGLQAPKNASTSATQVLSRSQVLERLNVTPELLLICLISCCNSLSSNLLDVFGKQASFRLVNTTVWGLCYMAAMAWAFLDMPPLGSEAGVLKFPTVCIVGFVPHVLILLGVVICASIYGIALVLSAYSLPDDLPQPTSIWQRFSMADENMQGASQFRNLRLNRREDFYTTLLRIGYAALTAASDAVFLNEGRSVVARKMTWLEEERLAEIEATRNRHSRRNDRFLDSAEVGHQPSELFDFDVPHRDREWSSGYGREKKLEKIDEKRALQGQSSFGGVGAFQGATRCFHGFSFLRAIFKLTLKWLALGISKLLSLVGISYRPQWLIRLAGSSRKGKAARRAERQPPLDFWILTDEGELELPEDHEFDVEREMRKREMMTTPSWGSDEEARFETKLYNWWKAGGSWGNEDTSGDYQPPPEDDWDTTSVVSAASVTTDSEWEDEQSDGRRTPTQENPFPVSSSRDSPQEVLLDTAALARLLNPRDNESRHEARVLASHLAGDDEGRIMTRGRFRAQVERERARILTTSRYRHGHSRYLEMGAPNEKRRLTPDEEAELLENLILSRRTATNTDTAQTWNTGAEGLGADGPQCVICQAAPRSIIAWPCRCLCICEDCRVSLAMNNFGSCVTCRRELGGFVRLWVP